MVSNSTEVVLGNIEKDSKYRKRIEDNTKAASHPRNQGIIMQAHHLISADAVKRSRVGSLMKQYGYDINCLGNLVLLPYTLEGACHLEVQLHRGNHASPSAEELLSSDDRPHPPSYHESVAKLLNRLAKTFVQKCEGADTLIDDRFRAEVNELSQDILDEIEEFSIAFQLTSIHSYFEHGKTGCGGAISVPQLSQQGKLRLTCPHGRNHENRSHYGLGKKFTISYKKQNYKIRVGK